MVILYKATKVFDKSQHPLIINVFKMLECVYFVNMIEYVKPIISILLNREVLERNL